MGKQGLIRDRFIPCVRGTAFTGSPVIAAPKYDSEMLVRPPSQFEEKTYMTLSEMLLPEFDQEMAGTRKTLERVPEAKFGWKPHEKSGTMIWLAGHLANLPEWAVYTIKEEALDMAPGGVKMSPPPTPKSSKELLEQFDHNVKAARAAIAGASDADLGKNWSLLMNGQTIFSMPRAACLRTWVMNHNVHHRAQLGVYLRLNGIAVPAIYGPSADESGM